MSKNWLADVSWSTIAKNVQYVETGTYDVTVTAINPNEPGAGSEEKKVGDYLIDYSGYVFRIVGTGVDGNSQRIRVEDVLEREFQGPYADLTAVIYRTKYNAIVLSQAQLRRLDDSAPDKINPIEKAILWKYRGVSLYDGQAKDGVTRFDMGYGLLYGHTGPSTGPWQGGTASNLSVDRKVLIGNTGTFTAGELVNGQITINHTRRVDIPSVALFDQNGKRISPANYEEDTENSYNYVIITMNYPFSGTIKYRVQ